MPYTPPAQLSPAASKATSPAPSRSQSYLDNHHLVEQNGGTTTQNRPTLPRSTSSSSYLSKHRRSPSFARDEDVPQTPDEETYYEERAGNGETNQVAFLVNGTVDPNGSLRQSPPPVSNPLIPTGATMSPPDSTHNSSDEEEQQQARGRQLENLAELQKAISLIEQRRESSPNRRPDEILKARLALEGQLPLASDNHPEVPPNSTNSSRPPLSREARKISHSRSSSELMRLDGTKSMSHSPNHYSRESSSDDDSEGGRSRPTMVRKKSGELVRPALRPPSAKRRPSSMPGTPTYSKAVHFDSHLEHVRHFLQVDRPAAVSAGSSPVEAYESEQEFPFASGPGEDDRSRSPPYEWEIRLTNFSESAETRKHEPVRVERIYLSSDNRNLICNIAVQNLAFQKLVVARFTFDYWKTTSEIVAEYNTDVRRRQNDGCDRFNFCLKLADQANLENRTLFFCVKYAVNGIDHWDNNNSMNYQVDFSKKARPQNGKGGTQKASNGLPKSRLSPNGVERPKSMPVSLDDFATGGFDNFGTHVAPPAALMGESPIKLKAPRSRVTIVSDAPTRKATSSTRAFGNRYDFGASLSAAIQNATTILGEQSGLSYRPDAKQSSREVPAVKEDGPTPGQVSNALAAGPLASRQATLMSEKPALQSQSYKELVDKYCFVGTTQPKGVEAKSVVKS